MMRANLLPHPKTTARVLGTHVDLDFVRQALVGLAFVALVALVGIGIERFRIHRLETAIDVARTISDAQASRRAEAKRLALDVARYQEFARRADVVRESGNDAARAIARIGNGVPRGVWLERLAHGDAGYTLTGGARDVDAVGGAILRLGDVPGTGIASLVSIDNRSHDAVRFDARIDRRSSTASDGAAP